MSKNQIIIAVVAFIVVIVAIAGFSMMSSKPTANAPTNSKMENKMDKSGDKMMMDRPKMENKMDKMENKAMMTVSSSTMMSDKAPATIPPVPQPPVIDELKPENQN